MSGTLINLECGMPTVEVAMSLLSQGLRSARAGGARYVKLVHGYGSSGHGGAIKAAVVLRLGAMQRAGRIKRFVSGEDFSPFSSTARAMLDACPELARDRDFARTNHGITVVLL